MSSRRKIKLTKSSNTILRGDLNENPSLMQILKQAVQTFRGTERTRRYSGIAIPRVIPEDMGIGDGLMTAKKSAERNRVWRKLVGRLPYVLISVKVWGILTEILFRPSLCFGGFQFLKRTRIQGFVSGVCSETLVFYSKQANQPDMHRAGSFWVYLQLG